MEKDGIQGFFKGLGAGYILVINPLIQFIIYEHMKKNVTSNRFFEFHNSLRL